MQYSMQVEWSEEDDCFVGSAPPLIGRCCHGDSKNAVRSQLSVIAYEVLQLEAAEREELLG